MYKEILAIFLKDLRMEWRQRHALGSVFLYVISSIFVAYIGFGRIENIGHWNALFWVIFLFAAFNATSRSFTMEGERRSIYLYTLVRPESIILAKIAYNSFILFTMIAASAFLYAGVFGVSILPSANWGIFTLALVLGSFALAVSLTLVAALAAQTDNNLGLMAILGLPVILPVLLIAIRLSKNALDGIAWSVNSTYALQLAALAILAGGLSYILFPYLWGE